MIQNSKMAFNIFTILVSVNNNLIGSTLGIQPIRNCMAIASQESNSFER